MKNAIGYFIITIVAAVMFAWVWGEVKADQDAKGVQSHICTVEIPEKLLQLAIQSTERAVQLDNQETINWTVLSVTEPDLTFTTTTADFAIDSTSIDPNFFITSLDYDLFTIEPCTAISICTDEVDITIDWSSGKIDIIGDPDHYTEAARIFFESFDAELAVTE